jgi:diguanylate cyclase (GGDEF)-like protein
METLSEVSRAAHEEDDLERLMHRVVDYLAARLDVPIASILLLDEPAEKFVVEVYAGGLELRSPGGGDDWPVTIGACGRCARTGEPVHVFDVQADPNYVAGHPDVRAEYITPIRHRGRILGVLNIESLRPDAFGEYDRAVLDAIAAQVAGSIHLASVKTRLEAANHELERIAQLDGLTGVANRRAFDASLDREWRRAVRERSWISLLLADLDHFKALNDARGHLHGDDSLRRAAAALVAGARRATDIVARYGGEEFAVLLPATPPDAAQAVAERIRAGIEELELGGDRGNGLSPCPVVTISVGAASTCPTTHAPDELIGTADRALYLAKHRGRNRVETSIVGD